MKSRISKIFDPESKVLAKNSSWLLLSTAFQTGVVFLKSIVIARSLGIENYGTYAVLIAFVATIQEIFNLNFGAALIKYAADFKAQGRGDKVLALIKAGYIVSALAAFVSIIGVALITYLFYNIFFEHENLKTMVIVFAAGSSLVFFNSIARVMLRINDKFKINSLVNMLMYTLEFGMICLTLFLYKGNLVALIFGLTIINIFNCLLCNGTAIYEVRKVVSGFWSTSLSCLNDDRKKLTGFLINNSLSKTLQKILKKGDILLLAAFAGPAQVATYDVARKLSYSLLMIKDPLIMAVYPQIATLISTNQLAKLKRFLKNVSSLAIIPYVLGAVTLFFVGDWIIELFFGKEFIGAGNILSLLVMAVGLEIVFFWTVPYVLSLGKTAYRLRVSLVSALITFGLGYTLVQQIGAEGIAFSILIGAIIIQSSFGYVILKHIRNGKFD